MDKAIYASNRIFIPNNMIKLEIDYVILSVINIDNMINHTILNSEKIFIHYEKIKKNLDNDNKDTEEILEEDDNEISYDLDNELSILIDNIAEKLELLNITINKKDLYSLDLVFNNYLEEYLNYFSNLTHIDESDYKIGEFSLIIDIISLYTQIDYAIWNRFRSILNSDITKLKNFINELGIPINIITPDDVAKNIIIRADLQNEIGLQLWLNNKLLATIKKEFIAQFTKIYSHIIQGFEYTNLDISITVDSNKLNTVSYDEFVNIIIEFLQFQGFGTISVEIDENCNLEIELEIPIIK